jgi:hypothetical protein
VIKGSTTWSNASTNRLWGNFGLIVGHFIRWSYSYINCGIAFDDAMEADATLTLAGPATATETAATDTTDPVIVTATRAGIAKILPIRMMPP